MDTEEWRPIPTLPGYEASSLGRIRSWRAGCWTHTRKQRSEPLIRRLVPNKRDGHLLVGFNIEGHYFLRPVHQLVLEAFKGPRPPGLLCRHLDGDPTNNKDTNLQWGTSSENWADMIRHGTDTRGERNGGAKLTTDAANAIRSSPENGVTMAARYGVSEATISRIRAGVRYAS
jgi:hypothetical protein